MSSRLLALLQQFVVAAGIVQMLNAADNCKQEERLLDIRMELYRLRSSWDPYLELRLYRSAGI